MREYPSLSVTREDHLIENGTFIVKNLSISCSDIFQEYESDNYSRWSQLLFLDRDVKATRYCVLKFLRLVLISLLISKSVREEVLFSTSSCQPFARSLKVQPVFF